MPTAIGSALAILQIRRDEILPLIDKVDFDNVTEEQADTAWELLSIEEILSAVNQDTLNIVRLNMIFKAFNANNLIKRK